MVAVLLELGVVVAHICRVFSCQLMLLYGLGHVTDVYEKDVF